MAEKLCTLRTKGGGGGGTTMTETVLWQNPSPSSDFAAQTITLSDGMSNYDYLAIAFTAHKTSTDEVRTIISVEDLGKLESSLNKPLIRFAGTNSTPTSVSRQFLKVSDTTISIGGGYYTNTSGSSNSYAIPIQVVGIKKGRVPSYKTVKDFIYDKVFNSGLPEIATLTSYNNRGSLVEGKIVADAVSHKVYAYVDFNVTTSTATSSWYNIFSVSSGLNNYRPMYGASSRQNGVPFITDDNSTVPTAQFWLGGNTGSSSTDNYLATCYGEGVTQGEHYILYMAYTYK